ncbi:hypothetical protein GF367_04590 [Candidatus Woesearchaeota archaeon]|nr:hypothetical protein [Candidatus Woesearchaeota archaeon]
MGSAKNTAKQQTKKKKEGEEMKPAKHGQSWSIDLIVGVIIFMLVIAIFYAFVGSKPERPLEKLQEDARMTKASISDDEASLGIIVNGRINETRFDELCSMPYEELKDQLGIENDVCIYLEDDQGNIIPCGANKAGIGNGEDIEIGNDVKCGATIP